MKYSEDLFQIKTKVDIDRYMSIPNFSNPLPDDICDMG